MRHIDFRAGNIDLGINFGVAAGFHADLISLSTSVPPTSAPIVPTAASSSGIQSPPEPANLPGYTLLKVVDGDTIDINYNGRQTPVRLIGMNTPETVDPNTPVQCYGPEASARAKAIFSGVSTVQLASDPTQGDRDKYNRLLRYVWLPNGTLFDLEMITEGYAYEYTYNTPYKYQGLFSRLSKQPGVRRSACGRRKPATDIYRPQP